VPFNEACAKRHGIDNPIVDPVEVEVVKDWPTPEVTYCAPDFWREVRRLLENIFQEFLTASFLCLRILRITNFNRR